MKILYYNWNSLAQIDLIETLIRTGNEVVLTTYRCSNYEFDPEFENKLLIDLESYLFDFVFSFNYFPAISNACMKKNVKYISWIFDSPCLNVYSHTASNNCNIIFHFDNYACELLKHNGLNNIYTLPLAANVSRLDNIQCTNEEVNKYASNVSFVGRLYDKKNFYDQISYLPDYLKGYLNGIMQSQELIYGYNFLHELLTDDIMYELKRYIKLDLGTMFTFDEKVVFSNLFLSQKVTSMERINLLKMISQVIMVDLYSDYVGSELPLVNHKGYIDSDHEASKVYKNSFINLNISLRSIITGIPLRVFDILGAGGFLITNYQAEILSYFIPGEDLVIYESRNDLLDKIRYYLSHDNERKHIALSAKQKIKEGHTFEHRIKVMLETAFV